MGYGRCASRAYGVTRRCVGRLPRHLTRCVFRFAGISMRLHGVRDGFGVRERDYDMRGADRPIH